MGKWRHESERYKINPRALIETHALEVENIDEETTPSDLRRLFSKHGEVLSVAIEAGYESVFFADRDPESQEAIESDKVIGRVTMLANDVAIAARELQGRRWRGKKLKLKLKRNGWDSVPPDFE
jgi:RNA recognition motif-containing protein